MDCIGSYTLKEFQRMKIGFSPYLKEKDSDITILVPVNPIDDTNGGPHNIHSF